jgi:sugar phosphate isomerase/epimerase
MLNSMAGNDFIVSLDQQVTWGVKVLDLKDRIFGKSLLELTNEEANEASHHIQQKELSIYCFSTMIFEADIEMGEVSFKQKYLKQIDRVIELAHIMKPRIIRLIAAQSSQRKQITDSMDYIQRNLPWVIPMYRKAINDIYASGYQVTIENEAHQCIFSTPEEIIGFFRELDCQNKVSFTYDVQNLWQMGTFPTIEAYRKLAPLIGYYHVKGGQKQEEGNDLCWKSTLEDASWPVKEITRQVVKERKSPVICINPSHGGVKDGYNYNGITKSDLDFTRKIIDEVSGL